MDNLIKKLISIIINLRESRLFSKKMKRIYNGLLEKNLIRQDTNEIIKKHIEYWQRLGLKIDNLSYSVFSSVSGYEDPLFVPEIVYYNQIEPKLNNRMMTLASADKNIYEYYFSEFDIFPKTLIRKIEDVYYDSYYNLMAPSKDLLQDIIGHDRKVIIKKTYDTGGGLNVGLFVYSNGIFHDQTRKMNYTLDTLTDLFGFDYVIQEYIQQHDFYSRFNPSSINTIRIFTYRSVKNNVVIPLQAVFRIGRPGKITDNQASGGISCGINREGTMNDFAIDKYGNKYLESNGIRFSDIDKVYMFEEMSVMAIRIAQKQFYSRLLGFDFCVDNLGKVRLLEINNSNIETNFLQMNNGPLFGSYTEEIVQYCLHTSKTICLDFRI
jgi:hypothetical protein